MNLDPILRQYAWNLAYAEALIADVDETLWATSGGPGLENHPAWTLGHLVTGSALVLNDLGVDAALPDGWRDLFERRGPNDPRRPDGNAAAYPSKSEVWDVFARLHAQVDEAVRTAGPATWTAKPEWRFDGYLPTELDALIFMLVTHEALHLGQLGCWRRHLGLPSAMAAMGRGG